ncbi:ribonuclease P protein component [Deinococcus antarcticus]|uniref:Ribonuclease P protein component n=1 Tax=Deinococcus antarcticus TaxID=1298767 RepID=A0ABV8AAP0_9DEIO
MKGEKEFRKVRSHGVAVRDALFTLRVAEYRPRFGETWRPRAIVGIVVSKKTLKHAVKRNRARRRVREALRTLPGGLPPCRAILMPNPAVLTVPFPELQAALARALAKAPGRVKAGKSGGQPRRGNQSGGGRVTASMNSTPSQEEM